MLHLWVKRRFHEAFEELVDKHSAALIAPDVATRAVVFVHGFGGHATRTWWDVESSLMEDGWWDPTDLFFFGYDSAFESIPETAANLDVFLRSLLPTPPRGLFPDELAAVRTPTTYEEIVLVGHSQGGLVIRQTILQNLWNVLTSRGAADACEELVARARVRLFSPALFGAREAGLLALARSVFGLGTAIRIVLAPSPSYKEMQQGSELLGTIRQLTEEFARDSPAVDALRASIAWAGRDRIVLDLGQYLCDPRSVRFRGTDHRSVCKSPPPRTLEFVARGIP